MNAALHTVHVRVNDAATGQPTPVRLRITDPDGTYYAPFGRLTEFATGRNEDVGGNVELGARRYAYIDGGCEIRLPAGQLLVEIHKGPEYVPLRQEISLAPGKLALRFNLERWTNARAERWYSGDTRAHFLSPHAALLEAAAEDLAVVNLLAVETRIAAGGGNSFPAIPNLLAFSGQRPVLELPGHLVAVNTLNSHPALGSLALLNCHRVVYPLSFGGPDGREDWNLAAWCEQCHRKGGLVVWAKTAHEAAGFRYGEPLADLVLGKIDAFEVGFFEDSPFDVLPLWYALLNSGLHVPLVGASGKDGNGVALGTMRTYARLLPDEGFTYRAWIEAVRAGRSFVTNGPVLSLEVNGDGPGTHLALPAEGQRVRVLAHARSIVPFDQLELLFNGNVVAQQAASGSPVVCASLEAELPVTESGWLAARCRGGHLILHRPASQRIFAHTSPVYLDVEGRPFQSEAAAVQSLAAELERMQQWARHEARCDREQQRAQLEEIFRSARELLLRRRLG